MYYLAIIIVATLLGCSIIERGMSGVLDDPNGGRVEIERDGVSSQGKKGK
jgi:hypothetical protein